MEVKFDPANFAFIYGLRRCKHPITTISMRRKMVFYTPVWNPASHVLSTHHSRAFSMSILWLQKQLCKWWYKVDSTLSNWESPFSQGKKKGAVICHIFIQPLFPTHKVGALSRFLFFLVGVWCIRFFLFVILMYIFIHPYVIQWKQ